MNALRIENLTKIYPQFTLQNLSFTLERGRIMGLIGKNGAGKTTVLLPVRKRDAVKAKLLLAAFAEIVQLLLSVPFAFLRTLYLPDGNPVGIEANAAYYGFGLMIFGVFNLVFFTRFFKTAYKAGTAFLIALLPAALGIFAMEAAVRAPGLEWLDGTSPELLARQLPVLLAGAAVYAGTWLWTLAAAGKRFEKVDL